MTDEQAVKATAESIVSKFIMDTKDSDYTVIEGDDAEQLALDIAAALAASKRAVWEEAAQEFTNNWVKIVSQDPAYDFVAHCRQQAEAGR